MTLEFATPEPNAASLRQALAQARQQGMRARDAAQSLGLSEGAALALHLDIGTTALQVTALRPPWLELLAGLEPCGQVMGLTRNHSVVHEKHGIYRNFRAEGEIGLCLNPDIDLRLFLRHWYAAMAVLETDPSGATLHSLQFFDPAGEAVHKIYARAKTDLAAWKALVQRFEQRLAPGQSLLFQAPSREPLERPDTQIDAHGLRHGWAQMQDTHEFHGLLRRFGCGREQSFRLAPAEFCQALQRRAAVDLLERAAASGVPIMVFVANRGCIQIHSGSVQHIRPLHSADGAQWINVLDPGFNLHLRSDLVRRAWLVRKPSADGLVTSVELFDGQGRQMAMFFGLRKPGQPELPAWRALAEELPREI